MILILKILKIKETLYIFGAQYLGHWVVTLSLNDRNFYSHVMAVIGIRRPLIHLVIFGDLNACSGLFPICRWALSLNDRLINKLILIPRLTHKSKSVKTPNSFQNLPNKNLEYVIQCCTYNEKFDYATNIAFVENQLSRY